MQPPKFDLPGVLENSTIIDSNRWSYPAIGFFIFLTIKYILESVIGQVDGIHGIVKALDNRVKTMNHDIIRLDATMCAVLVIRPDLNRIARADGKEDARRD